MISIQVGLLSGCVCVCVCVFGCAGSSLLHGLFSTCSVRASSVTTGSRTCGLQESPHMGSVVAASGLQSTDPIVVAHGLSCFVVCGMFPDRGLNPCLLHRQADSLPLSHPGHPFFQFLKNNKEQCNWNRKIREGGGGYSTSQHPPKAPI